MIRTALQCLAFFAATSAVAAPGTYSEYSLGGGSALLRSKHGAVRSAPSAIGTLAFGWNISSEPLYVVLNFETYRIYQIDPVGSYTGPPNTRHEGIGIGIAMNWHLDPWQFEAGLTRGQLSSYQETEVGRRQKGYSYYSPNVDAGILMFNTEGARIVLNMSGRRVTMAEAWHDQYGYRDIWTLHLLLALHLSVSSDHRLGPRT